MSESSQSPGTKREAYRRSAESRGDVESPRGAGARLDRMVTTGERVGTALVIGIGEYLHAGQVWPLRFAARDAEAVADALLDPEVCGLPAPGVKLLTDSDACRDAVAHHLSK